jgi:hypothetical protein
LFTIEKALISQLYRNSFLILLRWLAFLLLPFFFFLPSCRVSYSFTGASISPSVKTVSIIYFQNNAPLVIPTLSRTITDALVDRSGDLSLDGTITQYLVQPVAIQGNETAAMNRLTIMVNIKFTNKTDTKQNWETTFSRYQDYSSTYNLASVQDGLIKEITDQLVQDIFNKAVVNW